MSDPMVGVVVLAWQDEQWLDECLGAILASIGVQVQLVLVDNGCTRSDLDALTEDSRITLLRPGTNTGFAGGCNLGAAALGTEYLAFVNSDCALAPDTLAQLVAEARQPDVGPVMASIRHADRPELINSAGNPVHLFGVSWAGRLDEREERTQPFDVTGASGATLMLRHELWRRLDGFDDAYFAYLEDTELSLRCRRLGLRARCVPTALAYHHYEFSRNATKMYLLERNRLMLLATMWPVRALAMFSPLLLVLELGVTGQACAQGWGGQKVRGWMWLWRHRAGVGRRRELVRGESRVADREWMEVLTPRLDPHVIGSPALTTVVNAAVAAYWRLARRWL